MKKILSAVIFFTLLFGYSQKKTEKYYNEEGKEISKKLFKKRLSNRKNIKGYIEDSTAVHYALLSRSVIGKLDNKNFSILKSYLDRLSGFKLDTTKFIVINYLSSKPAKSENTKPKSTWNVLDLDYFRKLNKIGNIQQYSICNPANDNLKYFHEDRINWLADDGGLIKRMFFLYDVKYGGFLIIRPNGVFVYFLGEHSKYRIWETAKKFLNKD